MAGGVKKIISIFHRQSQPGFTLVEALVDFTIVSLIALAVLASYSASFRAIRAAKTKIASVALANEKMEELRNMPYDSLATEHGPIYPPGNLLDSQTINQNDSTFSVATVISYVDDPFDNLAPTDPNAVCDPAQNDCNPSDYKKIEITVTEAGKSNYSARLSSNIAAKAAETTTSSGILRLCVIDSTGEVVPGATVTIKNTEVSPVVDITTVTGASGCVMIPNLPPDEHNHYHITATKDGFSIDYTSPRTAQNPNALHPDINILIQQVTNQTLIIDRISTIIITVVDETDARVASAAVHVQGAKEIYFNPTTPKYSQDFTTDANGQVTINNMEFDDYTITIAGWSIMTTSPYQPVGLKAGVSLDVNIRVTHSAVLPRIYSAEPLQGVIGESVSVLIKGQFFDPSAGVKLVDGTGGEIAGTNIVVTKVGSDERIEAIFNLVGATAGPRDIVITNPDGGAVRQVSGFTIISN